jgi:hypothetical protein
MDAYNSLVLKIVAAKGGSAIIDNSQGQYDVVINCTL